MSTTHLRLALAETIHCPSCGHAFALRDGLHASVLQRLELDEAAQEKHLRDRIAAEERRKLEVASAATAEAHARALAEARASAKLELARAEAERDAARKQLEAAVTKALADAKAQAKIELDALRRHTTEQEKARESQLTALRTAEIDLRKQLAATELARAQAELDAHRRLDAERAKIRSDAMKEQEERGRRALADAERKLAEARTVNDELNRKLQQGSQQSQGEAGEIDVQAHLAAVFRHDEIESVPTGAHGADFIQHIRTHDGQDAGCIVWEVKVTAQFRAAWIEKLKSDAREHRARLAVLVTTTMPRGCDRLFLFQDGVLIVADSVFKAFADIAREFVLRQHLNTQLARTSSDQMARLLDYALRGALPERLNASLVSLHHLATQQQQETNYLKKVHAKRASLIHTATESLQAIKGEVAAILRDSEADQRFALPEIDGDEGNDGDDDDTATTGVRKATVPPARESIVTAALRIGTPRR